MATDEDYPIDLPILVIEAQIFVAVNKFQFLPNKLIPNEHLFSLPGASTGCLLAICRFKSVILYIKSL